MAEKVVGGLKWVKGEIALTLRRVRDLLEERGRTGERHSLDDALHGLLEVRGVLLALQLTLPARLVEEMQRLVEALAEDSVRSPRESAEALMLGLIQLPNYLDRLDAGADPGPLTLWPIVNDLRESRGAPPITPAELLIPASVLATEQADLPPDDLEELSAVLRKVRPHFHRYLVEWYRPESSADGLIELGRLFHQIYRYLKQGVLADLFRLAEAYADSLQGGQATSGPVARSLVSRLDKVLKSLTQPSPEWPDADARRLIVDLLDALAESEVRLPLIDELQALYSPSQSLSLSLSLSPEGASEALAGLASATLGEIAPIKERLDLFVRGDRTDRTPLDEIRASLNALARTLDVADTGQLPERLRLLADGFGELAMTDQGEDVRRLEPLASELLSIEALLQAYADRRTLEPGTGSASGLFAAEVTAATLREAREELVHVKEAIVACQSQSQSARPASFVQMPDRLTSIAGALQILGEDPGARAAEAIGALVRRRYVAMGRWPLESELPHLVDAVAALELHVERLEEVEPFQGDLMAQAAESLAALERVLDEGPRSAIVDKPDAGAELGEGRRASPGAAPTPIGGETSEFAISPELLEIFLEEAEDETRSVAEQFARWSESPGDEVALSSLRRSFHTLKGSGRLVGAERVGEVAQVTEALLNRVIEGVLSPEPRVLDYLADVIELLPELIRAEAEARPLAVADLARRGAALARGEAQQASPGMHRPQTAGAKVIPWPTAPTPHPIPESPSLAADSLDLDDLEDWLPIEAADPIQHRHGSSADDGEPGRALPLAPEATWAAAASASEPNEIVDHVSLFACDSELLDIFHTETGEHLADLRRFLERAVSGDRVPDETTLRALHTLTGSARMAGVDSIADAAKALERQIRPLQAAASPLDDRLIGLLMRAVDGIATRIEELPEPGPGAETLARLTRDVIGLAQTVDAAATGAAVGGIELSPIAVPEPETTASERLKISLGDFGEAPLDAEAASLLQEGQYFPAPWDLPGAEDLAAQSDSGHTLAAGEDTLDSAIRGSDLASFFSPTEYLQGGAGLPEDDGAPAVHDAVEPQEPVEPSAPIAMEEEAVARATEPAETTPAVELLPVELLSVEPLPVEPRPVESVPIFAEPLSEPALEPAPESHDRLVAPEPISELGIAARAAEPPPVDQPPGVAGDLESMPPDPELAGLFLEDARDLLDRIDSRIREWQLAPRDLFVLDGINRLLHTLKGSARLTGLTMIGDLSHALETRLTAVGTAGGGVDDTTLELAQRAVDTLSLQVDALEQGASIPAAADLVDALSRASQAPAAAPGDMPDLAVLRPALAAVEVPARAAPFGAPPAAAEREAVPTSTVPQIRVRSDLLNRLVDNAGEIGLYRARLTQRNGLLGYGLGELEQTVRRLRDQMRLMEIEAETQILYRFEPEEGAGKDSSRFDPLELDRFSMLQQLSRSLAETINDLVSLKELLGGYQREVADLLTQQARLADDLQDGLLRTRMVPFVQVVPRLHRLVRQTAENLGKSARLEVTGPEVELDRTILDRLVAPLEHLLRNAVDHGLEGPEARAAAGKSATGLVALSLSREGNDVVIGLADDGRGLDLQAIRRQAVARGLLAPQVDLADEALMQFVFEPGFTTAGRVTQISGRGVGLDVVASEIKASNGSIGLRSVPGGGTRFTIRLPLTLAIIEALLVSAGDTIYALPHATLDGVARIARDELAAIYKGKGKDFEHRGELYRVAYLGGVLDARQEPDLGERRWLPLLLTRVGDLRVALQVDSLIESTRILVKPLGPQLAGIRWLSGGTILPDGRVALILDALALLRSGAIQDYLPTRTGRSATADSPVCVMVVDDSLTVRRVTSRILRRQNIEVLTAKDGVEALTLLDERLPDVMLLDIEMPRMDGYELTRHIRRSDGLRDLPIIMITSRTGEKHRELAMALGVNRYLGKPYQESELLDEIGALLAERES